MSAERLVAVIGGSAAPAGRDIGLEVASDTDTPWGKPSGPVRAGSIEGRRVLWLARHGEPHAIAPHRVNYRANLYALQTLGATDVIALNTVGGIAAHASPGSLWLPDQLIDYTWGRAASFHDGESLPLRHIEFGEPFDLRLRALLARAASDCGIHVSVTGVYGCTQGPRLETAAEILRMRRDGCDLVGMTAMPEAALARELGLRYASLAMVVNPAAGLAAEPITMEAITREAAGCMERVLRVLACALTLADQGFD